MTQPNEARFLTVLEKFTKAAMQGLCANRNAASPISAIAVNVARETLAELEKKAGSVNDKTYTEAINELAQLAAGPAEQAVECMIQSGVAQWVKTRFMHIGIHNDVVDQFVQERKDHADAIRAAVEAERAACIADIVQTYTWCGAERVLAAINARGPATPAKLCVRTAAEKTSKEDWPIVVQWLCGECTVSRIEEGKRNWQDASRWLPLREIFG